MFAGLLLVPLQCAWAGAAPAEPIVGPGPKPRIERKIDDSVRSVLPGNRHPLALAVNDAGPVDDALRLDRLILVLRTDSRQASALDALLADRDNPGSPRFRQRMEPMDFQRNFGVAQGDIDAVTAWLQAHGFTVDEIPVGGRSIVFSGTVAQVRAAFRTPMRFYRHGGERHIANAGDPEIPAALAPVVAGVVSLHDFHSRPLNVHQAVGPEYSNGSTHYLAPGDFATIYNLKPLYARSIDGSGRSIAILGRSNVVLGDIQQFRSAMNLQANPLVVVVNGSDPGLVSGDQGESDLDLEWAGAVAPGATVKFITSKTTGTTDGIDLSAQYAVSNNVADVISLSYGQCEASMGTAAVTHFHNLWQQAVAQGMTVVVSSGDSGAAGCDSASASAATHGRGVNGLCSSPYSVCVGGTQFADTASPGTYWSAANNGDLSSALSYIPEVVWNESGSNGGSGLWASGGGASSRFSKPSWQAISGVPADGKRDVPDVSLTAATHDGYLVYSSDNASQTQTLYAFGGTSASAPAFAGILALAGQAVGYRLGSANPTLYGLAIRQAAGGNGYFHTITAGNNSVPGVTGYAASTGSPYYNLATGLGSVDGNVLVSHWSDLLPVSTTTLTVSANPIPVGQALTLTATVSGTSPSGTVQFSDSGANLGSPVAVSGGVASLATGSLAAGSHTLAATYSGDAGNQPSTSGTITEVILAASSIALSAAPQTLAAGQTLTLTVAVNGTFPTGSVQFKDNGSNLGAAVALLDGSASLATGGLVTAGIHAMSAEYSGDAWNSGSTSSTSTVAVTRAATAVAVTSSAPTITLGSSVTFTATVSGVGPTGTVQFYDGTGSLGSASLAGGVTTLATTALGLGSHSISAAYGGDANNLGSVSPPVTETVAVAGTSDGEVPALPGWGVVLLALVLAWIGRHGPRGARRR